MGDPGPPGKKVILVKIYGSLYLTVEVFQAWV